MGFRQGSHSHSKGEAEDWLYAANSGDQEIEGYVPMVFPEVSTCAAKTVTATSATLCGEVNPNGIQTRGFFKYGTTEGALTAQTPVLFEGSGTAFEPVSYELTDLIPNQEYFYQAWVEAEAEGVERQGSAPQIESFRTLAPYPEIPSEPTASFVQAQSALLNASINPEHSNTEYDFQYYPVGKCNGFEAGCRYLSETAHEESSIYGLIGVAQEAKELQPATTYTYRLIANNAHEEEREGKIVHEGGESQGPEGTFTTASTALLQAQTGPATDITHTTATISGNVNPGREPATYRFELGIYAGVSTQFGIIYSGSTGVNSGVAEEFLLTGLQPSQTYAYRLSIHSGYGEAIGNTMTFTTSGLPAVLVTPNVLEQLPIPKIAFPKAFAVKKAKAKKKAKKKKKSSLRRRSKRPATSKLFKHK